MTIPAVSAPTFAQKASAYYQDLKQMDWRFIAVTIAEISLQVFCTYWSVFVFYVITPAVISPVVLPLAALCSAAVAPFILTPGRPEPLSPEVPRGIHRQEMNCWINTQFQMMMADVEIKKWILSDACPLELLPFQQFTKEYEAAAREGRPVVNANSQALRICLSSITEGRIRASSLFQEDMTEGMRVILGKLPKELGVQVRERLRFSVPLGIASPRNADWLSGMPLNYGDLSLEITGENPSLNDLIEKGYFRSTSTNPDHKVNRPGIDGVTRAYKIAGENRQFQSPPHSLWIDFKRFLFEVDAEGNPLRDEKINTPIDIPEAYQINSFSEKDPTTYQLDAFAVHLGETRNSGHYIAFRLEKGHWYRIDDHSVIRISREEMRRDLQKAYQIHYSRT